MTNPLLSYMRNTVENKVVSNKETVANRTRFTIIDILSAEIKTNIQGYPTLNCGLFPKFYSLIAESGLGKSSLGIFLGCSIVDRFNAGSFFDYDLEGNTTQQRVKTLTNWDDYTFYNKFNLYSEDATTLEIQNHIDNIANFKEQNKKEMSYRTDFRDMFKKPITSYQPTYVLIDSVAKLSSLGREQIQVDKTGSVIEKEQLNQNTDGMIEAKNNKAFINQVKPKLSQYNIVLVMINHLVEQPQTSRFQKPIRQHPNLPLGYKLQGGNELVFQSFGLIQLKLKESITDRDPFYGDHIRGFVANLEFVKNKSTVSGIPFRVVFDKQMGYIPELSDWEYLFTTKYGFSGSPMSYRLDILPEIHFTRKTLFSIITSNALLARALNFTASYKMISDIHLPMMSNRPISALAEKMSYAERVALINAFSHHYPFYSLQYNLDDYQALNAGNLYLTQQLLNSKYPILTSYDYDINQISNRYVFGRTQMYTPFDAL